MRVLLVGNGAREHAIAEKLSRDCELFSVMSRKNPAIARLSKEYWIADIEDPQAVSRAVAGKEFDLGFASPDASLAAGVSDALASAGMAVASPTKSAARIEWDKSFMRGLLERHRIKGSPRHEVVKTPGDARRVMRELGDVAIKPLGLTGGKGVKVSGDHFGHEDEGMAYAEELLRKDGSALIEEKIIGEEFTFQAFCDGVRAAPMPPVQDHKRAFEHDRGPNTGGMGSYSTGKKLPFMDEKDLDEAGGIIQAVVQAMRKEGAPFTGILYGQFMSTPHGVRVVEFNARFGDPEAMNVIALMEGSLTDAFLSMAEGRLAAPSFSDDCTVVKYLVPDGYPDSPKKDAQVELDDISIGRSAAKVYFASVYEKDGKILTTGSRSFGVLGRGKSLEEAEVIAEKACGFIRGPVWHRKDIGTSGLVGKRTERMRLLRGRR